MYKKKSLFIVFEGIEGSGKSYLSKKLYHDLLRKGKSVILTREPGGTKTSEKIRQIILDDYFINYNPKPSLLHGDLWIGNVAFGQGGEPVIYDPATYRGDREAEFGLAEMFGGFESDFWAAYESEHPLHPGYSIRKLIYRLYHLSLIHI